MAANLENSVKTDKPRTIKTPRGALAVPVITPAEAVQILGSAINYCRQAGLVVRLINDGGQLVIAMAGVNFDGTADLVLLDAPEP